MAAKRKRPVKHKTHCRRCCRRNSGDELMGTINTGAKVVIAAGVLGAISNSFNR